MNNVVLIGRLTKDPDLRYIPNTGTPVSRFTLAIDRGLNKDKKMEAKQKGQPTADFINVVVWGKPAENCVNFLKKGILAAVHGRIQTGSYEGKDGVKKYTTEVIATTVEFLEWGDKSVDEHDYPDGFYPSDIDNDDIPF